MISTYTLSAFAKSVELLQSIRANMAHLRFTQKPCALQAETNDTFRTIRHKFSNIGTSKIKTQLLSQEKISRNTISSHLQRCVGQMFKIKAALRTQARFTAVSSEKQLRGFIHTVRLTAIEFFLKSRSDAEKPSSIMVGIAAADWYLVAVQCTTILLFW